MRTLALVERQLDLPILRVTAATIDALYRETPEAVARWRAAGAQVINMEATPLYAAARMCGVCALYIGHVSDELHGAEWKDWFGDDRDSMSRLSADIAVRVLEETLRHGG